MMRCHTTPWVVGAAAFAVAGCSADGNSSRGTTVRDSAGIRIVESSAPLLATGAWTVSATPSIEIGAIEDDSTQNLNSVEGAVRLSDGTTVVANAADPILRWYDSTGKFLHGTGRYGQGPGEFDGGEGRAWVYALWPLARDSVGTWEHSRRRMQVFDRQGKYARWLMIDLPPGMRAGAYPQIVGRFGNGFLAFLSDEREQEGPLGALRRDSVAFIQYNADGKFLRELGRLPGFARYIGEVQTRGGQSFRTSLSPPFAPPFATAVHGDRFYYGPADRYEITMRDTSGAVRSVIRRAGARRPLTAEMIARYKESRTAAVANIPDRLRAVEAEIARAPFPDSLPAYRTFLTDRDGTLWVQSYEPRGTTTSTMWSIFDTEGRWVTDVSMPSAWQIHDIGRDYVLVVETNDLDVEIVRVYPLVRASAGG